MLKTVQKGLIALIIFGQLCAQGFYFPGITIFPLYLILLIVLSIITLTRWLVENNFTFYIRACNKIPLVFIFSTANIIFVSVINNAFDVSRIGLIVCSMIFCLACYQIIDNEDDINYLFKSYIFAVFVSSLVEIGQVLGNGFCTEIWFFLHSDEKIIGALNSSRFLGLGSSALAFAYTVSTALIIAIFVQYKRANFIKKSIIFSVFLFALVTNNTRSAWVAVAIAVLIWLFIYTPDHKTNLLRISRISFFILFIVILVMFVSGADLLAGSRFENISDSADSMSRIPMILTAFNHAFHYPLGLASYKVDPQLIVGANASTYSYVVNNTAHNILGNCVACYGFIGLFLLFILYIKVFCLFKNRFHNVNYQEYFLAAFLAVLCLLINAFFHNFYIYNGDLSSYLFIAVVMSICKTLFIKEKC